MSKSLHKKWLKVTAIVVGSFGPAFFLGTMSQTDELARLSLDILSWPVDGSQIYEGSTMRFLSALTGGFLLGWGVMIWFLSGKVYDAEPEGVRRAVLAGMLSWFVLDSAGSILSGHWPNALFNVLVLLIAVGPMWRRANDSIRSTMDS